MERIDVTFNGVAPDGSIWSVGPEPIAPGTYITLSDDEGNSVEGVVSLCRLVRDSQDQWLVEVHHPDWSTWSAGPVPDGGRPEESVRPESGPHAPRSPGL